MRNTNLLLLLGSIVIMGLSACSNDDLNKKDFRLQGIDQLISAFNEGKNPATENIATKTQGNLTIAVGENLISMEYAMEGAKELKTYFLQTQNADHSLKSKEFGLVEVIYFGNELVVNSLERQQTLLFSVSNGSESSVKGIAFTENISGFGLGVETKIKGTISSRYVRCLCAVNNTSNSCDAGGPGSTNCSVSDGVQNCSVSCGVGFYSCCQAF